jgi:signal peptidase II
MARRPLPGLLLVSAAILLLDRVTKIAVARRIPLGEHLAVLPGVFYISHVRNSGAAFSLFADAADPARVRLGLILFSVAAVLAILYFLARQAGRFTLTGFALALILAGALGNVYDRIRFASVIDFLEVHIIHYHWPDFNMADSAIVIGGCLLLLDSFRTKPE